jgi:pimeloyl-ACP methyl ester carboxylesterase
MRLVTKTLKVVALVLLALLVLSAVFFGYTDKPVAELKEKYAPAPSAFLQVDGMDVHYRDEGNKEDSLPLVLIHGTGSSLHTFDAWTAVLKKEKRVIRMDLPAFGLTGPFPNRLYSMDHYVAFIYQFLATMGIAHCIIGGNSLGGDIAWNFTVQHPQMVQKLILIDAAGYPLQSQSVPIGFKLARIPVLNKMMTFITPKWMVAASLKNVYADPSKVNDALVNRFFELTLREGNRQALIDRMNLAQDTSKLVLIKNIQQPTLILWGEQDLLIPVQYAYRFQNDLPNDTLVVLKNAGHVPMEESPQESVVPLLHFLRK